MGELQLAGLIGLVLLIVLATGVPVAFGLGFTALLFLYKEVLQQDLPWLDEVVSARKARRLPVVLTQREVRELLLQLQGTQWLVASLLYGTGMRILEALRLRVKDVEFERREHIVPYLMDVEKEKRVAEQREFERQAREERRARRR